MVVVQHLDQRRQLLRLQRRADQAIAGSGLKTGDIDRVFLTGGSSFVPAVRRLFADRFGEAKLESGGELVSIASGLALIGAQDDADEWAERAGG